MVGWTTGDVICSVINDVIFSSRDCIAVDDDTDSVV